MKKGSEHMMFAHSPDGVPLSIVYDDLLYYYVTNIQGDVVAILDATGAEVVTYTYDAWGNILSIGGSKATTLGQDNPLRYRGYVYDTETDLYYVSSRYYDPEIGRWINADNPEILLEDQGNLLQHNLFAYCWNNPVNLVDYMGESPANIIGGIVGGVAGAALGYLLADALGLSGWKKAALIAAATVGGAALGAFLGPYVAKLGSKVAAKLGIKTAVKNTVKMSSKELWKASSRHIFSKKHIRNGIMRLGKSQEAIFNSLYNVVKSKLGVAVNGANEIRTVIKGYEVTIRFFVENGKVINIDAFMGFSSVIKGTLLK